MKRKHKQILIIWVGLLAGLLIFRGGWMTYAGLLIFLLDLGLVWWLLRCPHCGKSVRELRPDPERYPASPGICSAVPQQDRICTGGGRDRGTAAGGGPCDPVVRDPLPGVRGTSAAFSRRILQILRKQVGLG